MAFQTNEQQEKVFPS